MAVCLVAVQISAAAGVLGLLRAIGCATTSGWPPRAIMLVSGRRGLMTGASLLALPLVR